MKTQTLVTLPLSWLIGLLEQIPDVTVTCGYCGKAKPAVEVSVAIRPGITNRCDECSKRN